MKTALVVLVTLILILAGQLRLTLYCVEETLTVLLGIAALLLLFLLPLIAFILLWHGATFVFLCLKGIVGRVTSVWHRPLVLNRR